MQQEARANGGGGDSQRNELKKSSIQHLLSLRGSEIFFNTGCYMVVLAHGWRRDREKRSPGGGCHNLVVVCARVVAGLWCSALPSGEREAGAAARSYGDT